MLWLSVSDTLLLSCGVCERGGLGTDVNEKHRHVNMLPTGRGHPVSGRPPPAPPFIFHPAPSPDWSSIFAAKLDRHQLASPGGHELARRGWALSPLAVACCT